MAKKKNEEIPKGTLIDLTNIIIGIPLSECFQCGKTPTTRHHVIPKALNPIKNLTIPLCEKHKDICHPIVKQLYVPREVRRRMGKIRDNAFKTLAMIDKANKIIDFSKKPSTKILHNPPIE